MEKNKKGIYEPLVDVSLYSRITTMNTSSGEQKYDVISSSGVIFYLNLPDVSTALFNSLVKEMVSTMGPIREYLQRQETLEQAERERRRDILRNLAKPLKLGMRPSAADSESGSESGLESGSESDSWISD